MRESGNEITSSWVYNPDLFDAGTIARMAANYETLVQAAIADPKVRLSALCELLAGAEKQQRGSEHQKFQQAGLEKLKKIRRNAIVQNLNVRSHCTAAPLQKASQLGDSLRFGQHPQFHLLNLDLVCE
jgi:uncharacterized protein YcbK (DUF882 family)